MDRMWRLLVAVFFLCAALVMGLMGYIFGGTDLAVVLLCGVFVCAIIGIIKGFYNIWFYHPEDKEKKE